MKKLYFFFFFISVSCFLTGARGWAISALKEGTNIWVGINKPIQQPIPRLELNVPNTEPDFSQFKSELPNTDNLNHAPTPYLNESLLPSNPTGIAEIGKNYSVYQGMDVTGKVKYVGMTGRDPIMRFTEHLNSGTAKSGLIYQPFTTDLSRTGARILEQTLINKYGLTNLLNIRNSIAPQYWWLYGIKP